MKNHDGQDATRLITTNVAFIHQDASMEEAVKKMVAKKISSLLVYNHEDIVVGILTERDVVQKFTLLILTDKMTRSVGTVMTRPIIYACAEKFDDEIPRLHHKYGIRHFPIARHHKAPSEPVKTNEIIGMISTTDLAREYFKGNFKNQPKDPWATPSTGQKSTPGSRPVLTVLCKDREEGNFYQSIFEQLDFSVDLESDIGSQFTEKLRDDTKILIEFDTFDQEEQRKILGQLKSWPGQLVVSTAREDLLPIFRKHLHGRHQHVALKPLNLPHCAWLFGR